MKEKLKNFDFITTNYNKKINELIYKNNLKKNK